MKHEEFKKGNIAIWKSDIMKKKKRAYWGFDEDESDDYGVDEEEDNVDGMEGEKKDGKESEYGQFGMMNAIHLLFVSGNVVNS